MSIRNLSLFLFAFALCLPVLAGEGISVEIKRVDQDGVGEPIGHVRISESSYGLVLSPDLTGLDPGVHGFHLHANPSCESEVKDGHLIAALAAGGHYDPHGKGHHGSPWGDGHLGDLPALFVDKSGKANLPVLAPRLKVSDLKGRSLIVHAGGDNYSDTPHSLGGGGKRVACGVIAK